MSFRRAVGLSAAIRDHLCDGLQALKPADRKRVRVNQPRRLCGSVDLDGTTKAAAPDASRWDYVIGLKTNGASDHVVWMEVHPASSTHISEVLAKLHWLRTWIQAEAQDLAALPAAFVWVASGEVKLLSGGSHRRRLAEQGLRFAGRTLDLDSVMF
jgi:hypothetical protein